MRLTYTVHDCHSYISAILIISFIITHVYYKRFIIPIFHIENNIF